MSTARAADHHASRSRSTRSARSSGPKGKVINRSRTRPAPTLSIEDDGTVYIGATNGEAAEAAEAAVNAIANPTMPEVGERYLGTVVKTTNFGAFVSLLPGKDGLLHISKLRLAGGKRVEAVEDVVSVGQKIQVQIAEIDDRGKLSLIPVVEEAEGDSEAPPRPRPSTPSDRRSTSDGRPAATAGRLSAFAAARTGTPPAPSRPSRTPTGTVTSRVRRTVLPGGLRVVTEHMAGVRSASIGVWVGVGSRDETPTLHGCSHFLEHLLFKGTARALRDGHLGRARRGGRRVQRLHRQGVHLLPRAGARRGPAAGGRRARRHGHRLADHRRPTSRPSAT